MINVNFSCEQLSFTLRMCNSQSVYTFTAVQFSNFETPQFLTSPNALILPRALKTLEDLKVRKLAKCWRLQLSGFLIIQLNNSSILSVPLVFVSTSKFRRLPRNYPPRPARSTLVHEIARKCQKSAEFRWNCGATGARFESRRFVKKVSHWWARKRSSRLGQVRRFIIPNFQGIFGWPFRGV